MAARESIMWAKYYLLWQCLLIFIVCFKYASFMLFFIIHFIYAASYMLKLKLIRVKKYNGYLLLTGYSDDQAFAVNFVLVTNLSTGVTKGVLAWNYILFCQFDCTINFVALCFQQIVPPVLNSFLDQDSRVRYYACEALYNIAKVII
jgi:hypothetical protein